MRRTFRSRLKPACSARGVRVRLPPRAPQPDQFTRAFGRAVTRAGVPVIRLHDLRHTWATLALQAGVHPKVVSERLGHATTGITLDIYSHVQPELDAQAATRVAALFS